MKNKTDKTKYITVIKLLKSLTVSLFFAFSVFIFMPLNLYFSEKDNLIFSFEAFLPYCLHFAVLVFVSEFLILLFMPSILHKILYSVFFTVSILTLAQYFFSKYYVTNNSAVQIINFIIWIIIVSGSIILSVFIKRDKIPSVLSLFISIIILFTQGIYCYNGLNKTGFSVTETGDPKVKQPDNARHSQIDMICWDNLYPISKSKNIFYFCIDRFDERYAEKAYKKDKKIYSELDGFTWYQDNISFYGHTFPAVTKMLTGIDWEPQEKRYSYFNRAYSQKNYLSELNKCGYRINLYTSPYYVFSSKSVPSYVTQGKATINTVHYDFDGLKKVGNQFVLNSLYNIIPNMYRDSLDVEKLTMCNTYTVPDELRSSDLKRVYDHLRQNDFKFTNQNLFSFIHVDGCHYINYNYFWHKPMLFKKSITPTVQNSFKIVNMYLKAMKKAGVYDDATIIITGDHASAINDVKPLDAPRLTALFIKLPEQSFPLKISEKQVSHENIWPTIIKANNLDINLDNNLAISDIPNVNRIRSYTWDTYDPYGSTLDEYKYEIKGKGKDFNNWKIKSKEHYNKFLMD